MSSSSSVSQNRELLEVCSISSSTTNGSTLRTASNGLRQRSTQLLNRGLKRSKSTKFSDTQVAILNIEVQDATNIKKDIQRCNKCFSCSHCMFNPSLHSFPKGSLLSFVIAIIGMLLQFEGWKPASHVVYKYNQDAWWLIWIFAWCGSFLLIIVQTTIFFHGIALFIYYGSNGKRYCFGLISGEDQNCGICTSICGHVFVGIFGTLGVICVYFVSLSVTFGCLVVLGLSWVLDQSCLSFQQLVNKYIALAKEYLKKAFTLVQENTEKAKELLLEFDNIQDLTSIFDNSAIGDIVSSLASSTVSGSIETSFSTIHSSSSSSSSSSRVLRNNVVPLPSITRIDPQAEIASGIDALDVLNKTILSVEQQILYYEQVSRVLTEFCYDAASLYSSVIYLCIGAFVVSISQFLMFASHVKQFTAWSYEVELVRLLDVEEEENEINEEKSVFVGNDGIDSKNIELTGI